MEESTHYVLQCILSLISYTLTYDLFCLGGKISELSNIKKSMVAVDIVWRCGNCITEKGVITGVEAEEGRK